MHQNSEDDVRYRKLQPIYNAIDARNYKAAIKLCSKKDLEKLDIVKTLKAHALERSGRVDEALDLCREVKARNPTNDTILNTLVLTYKLTSQIEDATSCYETALRLQPDNEEHGRELFFCYCRQRANTKAQQLAAKLYKQFAKADYLFWTAVSMMLNVRNGGPSKILELAERMVEKGLVQCYDKEQQQQRSSPSAGELGLYVGLLEEQGQHERALDALRQWSKDDTGFPSSSSESIVDEGSIAVRSIIPMSSRERMAWQGSLLLRLQRWQEAVELYRASVLSNPDSWAGWLGLFDASMRGNKREACDLVDDGIDTAAALALSKTLQTEHPDLRGPFLAEMEVLSRLLGRGAEATSILLSSSSAEEQFGEAILSYMDRFAVKLCCFDDLRPYLSVLVEHKESIETVFHQVIDGISEMAKVFKEKEDEELQQEANSPSGRKDVTNQLQRFIRTKQVLKLLSSVKGGEDQQEELRVAVGEISREYSRTLFLNEETEGGQREVQQADELLLLAVHQLADLANLAESKSAYVARMEAIVLLEQGLRYSPYNYHFRLALLDMYDKIASWELALGHYNQLEIKQIQLDSLSWLLFPGCFHAAFFTEARVRCQHIISLHKSTVREADDHVTKALSLGTYVKALEIDLFQRRKMSMSLQLGFAKVHLSRLELLQRVHNLDKALIYLREVASGMVGESVDWSSEEIDSLSDNRDYSVVRDWSFRSQDSLKTERDARRVRAILSVKLGILLNRMILEVLQGEGSLLLERLPVLKNSLIHLEKLRCSDVDHDGEGNPQANGSGNHNNIDNKTEKGESHLEWLLCYLTMEAAGHLLVEKPSGATALPLLERLSVLLGKVEKALVSGGVGMYESSLGSAAAAPSSSLSSANNDKTLVKLLNPVWLKATSSFINVGTSIIYFIILKMVSTLGGGSTKKGKGKKNKAVASSILPAEEKGGEIQAAVRVVLVDFLRLLTGLDNLLKDYELRETSQEAVHQVVEQQLGPDQFLTFVGEADFFDLRCHVLERIVNSHRLSAGRLIDIIKDKVSELKAHV